MPCKKLYYIQISVSVDKVWLEHGHADSFIHGPYSCRMMAELGSCNRYHMAHETQNSYYLALYRKKKKNLSTPVLFLYFSSETALSFMVATFGYLILIS